MRLAPFLLFALLSCKSSGPTPEQIDRYKFYIDLHNITTKSRFAQDSIEEDYRLRRQYIDLKDSPQLKNYLKTHGEVFADQWNNPYDVRKDRFLTVEKYLDYCKAHGYDPDKWIEFL